MGQTEVAKKGTIAAGSYPVGSMATEDEVIEDTKVWRQAIGMFSGRGTVGSSMVNNQVLQTENQGSFSDIR